MQKERLLSPLTLCKRAMPHDLHCHLNSALHLPPSNSMMKGYLIGMIMTFNAGACYTESVPGVC